MPDTSQFNTDGTYPRADLVPLLGMASRVSEVLSGKRELSMTMVRTLRDRFRTSADLLVSHVVVANRSRRKNSFAVQDYRHCLSSRTVLYSRSSTEISLGFCAARYQKQCAWLRVLRRALEKLTRWRFR